MRLEWPAEGLMRVRLSRRNLLALLTKLEDPRSLRTLMIYDKGLELQIVAEEDDVHYADRAPGRLSDRTERDVFAIGSGRVL